MPTKPEKSEKPEGTPRDRLLAAANELFYKEGVHTVGIDRVIEHAGVAKASLYSTFGSKEELVRAYLQLRAEGRYRRISQRIATLADPRERILSVFDVLAESVSDPTYRGCAFINASAEGKLGENKVADVCRDWRRWLRVLFVDLARDFGAEDPEKLGGRLVMLYDGATVGASMDRDVGAGRRAREMAEVLLGVEDKATRGRGQTTGGRKASTARRSGVG